MITFMESKENLKETEKCIDSQLWHACAGGMVQMPTVDSKVFYFAQGHSEHAYGNVEFRNCPRIPAYIACRVSAVKFMADPETDEVYAKIRLVPLVGDDVDLEDGSVAGISGSENPDKPTSFAKTLTQSDANNGGGFSVPRYCAETIFPRLDYSADPPVQTILAKDVHGETWKFRHIYRGTPRRHLLTTGWSTFVNHKKLVAGDSIVFMRAENGDLCVGIRRAKRGIGEMPMGWNPSPAGGNSALPPYGGLSTFLREEESKLSRGDSGGSWIGRGRVKPEEVIEAATRAVNGQPFDVVFYPRASTPEFCVKASLVKAAHQTRWCSGMRFKMAFETEDSSRISWFMGTISSVQVADHIRWPDSPWRLLMVSWDEPDLLQNVKRVSPWQVELVTNIPAIHLSPFSPPARKKLRLPLPDGQVPLPAFSSNHFLGSSNPFGYNTPAGMQGARHAQYSVSLSDFHLSKLQSGLLPVGYLPLNRAPMPSGASNHMIPKPSSNENISCLLSIGNSSKGLNNKSDNEKEKTPFVLFGQKILTEKQIFLSCNSNDNDGDNATENSSSGQCKVFMESEEVGRTLDLSSLGSYEEMYRKLANMFDIEISEMLNRVRYHDSTGVSRQPGDEPYSNFTKTARRLTILADSSNEG